MDASGAILFLSFFVIPVTICITLIKWSSTRKLGSTIPIIGSLISFTAIPFGGFMLSTWLAEGNNNPFVSSSAAPGNQSPISTPESTSDVAKDDNAEARCKGYSPRYSWDGIMNQEKSNAIINLIHGGDFTVERVYITSEDGKNYCYATLHVQGVVNGTSFSQSVDVMLFNPTAENAYPLY